MPAFYFLNALWAMLSRIYPKDLRFTWGPGGNNGREVLSPSDELGLFFYNNET